MRYQLTRHVGEKHTFCVFNPFLCEHFATVTLCQTNLRAYCMPLFGHRSFGNQRSQCDLICCFILLTLWHSFQRTIAGTKFMFVDCTLLAIFGIVWSACNTHSIVCVTNRISIRGNDFDIVVNLFLDEFSILFVWPHKSLRHWAFIVLAEQRMSLILL